jgi:hypothetical protein
MATNILSDRLDRLLAQGILKPILYSAHRRRFEYRLTDKGRDLYCVLVALLKWGDTWFSDELGPPLLLTHNPCDHALEMKIECSECRQTVDFYNTSFELPNADNSLALV